jgi:hypothetical protein
MFIRSDGVGADASVVKDTARLTGVWLVQVVISPMVMTSGGGRHTSYGWLSDVRLLGANPVDGLSTQTSGTKVNRVVGSGRFSHPPDPSTRTTLYSPISRASLPVDDNVVEPVTPVFDCQVTFQFDVAAIGHLPAPFVRSFADIQVNLCPQGGSAFQS